MKRPRLPQIPARLREEDRTFLLGVALIMLLAAAGILVAAVTILGSRGK